MTRGNVASDFFGHIASLSHNDLIIAQNSSMEYSFSTYINMTLDFNDKHLMLLLQPLYMTSM